MSARIMKHGVQQESPASQHTGSTGCAGRPARALMDLLEYQGKQLLARHAVPVPQGVHAESLEEATRGAEDIGYPCVIKAQVLIGGRGEGRGVKGANDGEEAEADAKAILGM